MALILASASPRRSELLASLGLPFTIVPSHAEELHDEKLGPAELCKLNASRKAEDIARDHPADLVIGADTLVALEQQIFGKPKDLDEARTMLRQLSGQTHQVVTGVCLIERSSGKREIFAEKTGVTFKPLSSDTINAYLDSVPVLDKAGAYAIQEKGEMLVEKIFGSYSNVVGLPIEALVAALARWGYNIRSR